MVGAQPHWTDDMCSWAPHSHPPACGTTRVSLSHVSSPPVGCLFRSRRTPVCLLRFPYRAALRVVPPRATPTYQKIGKNKMCAQWNKFLSQNQSWLLLEMHTLRATWIRMIFFWNFEVLEFLRDFPIRWLVGWFIGFNLIGFFFNDIFLLPSP